MTVGLCASEQHRNRGSRLDTWSNKKMIASVAIIIIAIAAYSTQLDRIVNAIPVVQTMNQKCVTYLDDWSRNAVGTFIVTKGINAGLSVVADSELQVTIFGSGVTLAAGEVFRPLNDMIEKVASVSLASAVSLGIQKFLLRVGGALGLKWLLTLSMACWLVAIWADSFTRIDLRRLAYGILMAALLVRFFIPMTVLATGYIGEQYMEAAYITAQQKLETLDTEAGQIDVLESSDHDSPKRDIFSGIKSAVSGVRDTVSNLGDRLATMSDAYIGVAIDAMVIFILQTMIMPILILWGMVKVFGLILGSTSRAGIEERLLPFMRRSEEHTR